MSQSSNSLLTSGRNVLALRGDFIRYPMRLASGQGVGPLAYFAFGSGRQFLGEV